jgi:hypothetical protein
MDFPLAGRAGDSSLQARRRWPLAVAASMAIRRQSPVTKLFPSDGYAAIGASGVRAVECLIEANMRIVLPDCFPDVADGVNL